MYPLKDKMPVVGHMVTNGYELPGQRITKNLDLVREIIVRSRNIVWSVRAGIQSLFGGDSLGAVVLGVAILAAACASGSQAGVSGPYQSWDEVITRWVGANKQDLYYELGLPNLHPKQLSDGMTGMVWDMTIDRMPGQADEYKLLPLYSTSVNCQLIFIADAEGLIRSGRRIGCDLPVSTARTSAIGTRSGRQSR